MIQSETIVATIMGKPVTYRQTAQGAGYVFENGQFKVPERTSNLWDTVGNILKTGVDVWKTSQESKQKIRLPTQEVQEPIIFNIPPKAVIEEKPFGNILEDVPQALRTMALAPELVARSEKIGQQAQISGLLIFGGLIFLGLILLSKK